MNKKKKFVNFAVGAAGTILFQYFFKFTSFDHVKVFLYYSIAWLANIALLRPSCGDFGIFTFLLMNAIIGCTASQFGISGTTWLAYGACVFLHGLRLIVESLPLPDNWERLVAATLKRDLLRQLALQSSRESSFNSTATQSDFSYDSDNYNELGVVSKSEEEGGAGGGGGDVQNGGNQKEEERKNKNSRRDRGERRRSMPNPRLSNPPKNIHGEQVAAGWPSWLSAVAGEAINGWTPRRADTFEKLDKA
ncbi:hypothetical protein RD792_017185 [Penstemon davidsonii]|uniref:Transmembrane protein n=1 Tax=Penstemon davidsonii TaxID=160366 RepID=A0ABR0CLX0_9LAMI|nr:hypothetical protein RD792_017185 [Penstemon davidsonii]